MPVGARIGLRRRSKLSAGPSTDPAITGLRADGWSLDYASPPAFDPVGAPKYLSLSRQGFNAAGGATTYVEALLLTTRMRQAYPNQASLDATRVALSDYFYATDTVLGGPANASAETSPKPIARWALPDRRTVTAALRLEVVAAHRNARSREQVAAVKFIVTDGATTLTQIVATSTILGYANDRQPIVGYAATIDVSTLADGQITANAELYPWIGGAASVQKSSDNSAGSRAFCPQIYRKGASRTVLYAYVATTGNDTSGVASSSAATASATPCLTVAGAMAKIRAADAGSVTDGHVIRLKAGTQAVGTPANVVHSAISELTIEADPAAGSTPVLAHAGGWASQHAYLRFQNIQILRSGSGQVAARTGAIGFFTYENVAFNNGGIVTFWGLFNTSFRFVGCAFTNMQPNVLLPYLNSNDVDYRLMRGCTTDAAATMDQFCAIGCAVVNGLFTVDTSARGLPGCFVGFNRFNLQTGTAINLGGFGNVAGAAVIQNLVEFTGNASIIAFRFSADGDPGNLTHLCVHHNTLSGFLLAGRGNLCYADTAGTNRTHKLLSWVGNIQVMINTKHDVFATTTANVNAWSYLYGVGCRGEFSQFIGGGNGDPAFIQAFPGMQASIGASLTIRNDPLFTNYRGSTNDSGGEAGAGGGTYTLQAGSPCLGRVLQPVLRFDLNGNARPAANDASGAYLAA